MTKFEWENELKRHLEKLPSNEMRGILDYYDELFCDRYDGGCSEKEIIKEFGNPFDIANKILQDYNFLPNPCVVPTPSFEEKEKQRQTTFVKEEATPSYQENKSTYQNSSSRDDRFFARQNFSSSTTSHSWNQEQKYCNVPPSNNVKPADIKEAKEVNRKNEREEKHIKIAPANANNFTWRKVCAWISAIVVFLLLAEFIKVVTKSIVMSNTNNSSISFHNTLALWLYSLGETATTHMKEAINFFNVGATTDGLLTLGLSLTNYAVILLFLSIFFYIIHCLIKFIAYQIRVIRTSKKEKKNEN